MIIKRLFSAFRTNEPQATAVIGLTVLNGLALLYRTGETPIWFCVMALMFWPAIAFIANLIDPIPDDDFCLMKEKNSSTNKEHRDGPDQAE